MKLATALVLAANLSSIFALPLHTTTSTPNPVHTRQIGNPSSSHKDILVEGEYDAVTRTLSARIFDGQAETCTINAILDSSAAAAPSSLNFDGLDGYAGTILGDLTEVRYSAPGTGGRTVVLKRRSVDEEGKRNFVRSGQVDIEWQMWDGSVDEVSVGEVSSEGSAAGVGEAEDADGIEGVEIITL